MIIEPGKLYKVIQSVSLWDVDIEQDVKHYLTGEMLPHGTVIMACSVKNGMSCHKSINRKSFPQLQLTALIGKQVRLLLFDHQTKSPEEWVEEWLEEYKQ